MTYRTKLEALFGAIGQAIAIDRDAALVTDDMIEIAASAGVETIARMKRKRLAARTRLGMKRGKVG